MAIYRQVHVEFWQDGFVLDLTPEEKYFFLYLMTNSKTRQCGVYELPKRIIETETGYNRETVEKLLERFTQYGKIHYNSPTKEIIVLNWVKYNKINSPKVKNCIIKELQTVKYMPFIDLFLEQCDKYGYSIDTLSIPYLNSIHRVCKDYGEEEEKEGEGEEERSSRNVFSFYEDNHFGRLDPYITDEMNYWIDELSEELVIEALKIAKEKNKDFRYAKGILKSWVTKSVKTIADVRALEKEFVPAKAGIPVRRKSYDESEFDLDD